MNFFRLVQSLVLTKKETKIFFLFFFFESYILKSVYLQARYITKAHLSTILVDKYSKEKSCFKIVSFDGKCIENAISRNEHFFFYKIICTSISNIIYL